jgi:hypothetical protein
MKTRKNRLITEEQAGLPRQLTADEYFDKKYKNPELYQQSLIQYNQPNKNSDTFLDPDCFAIKTNYIQCSGVNQYDISCSG